MPEELVDYVFWTFGNMLYVEKQQCVIIQDPSLKWFDMRSNMMRAIYMGKFQLTVVEELDAAIVEESDDVAIEESKTTNVEVVSKEEAHDEAATKKEANYDATTMLSLSLATSRIGCCGVVESISSS